MDRPLPRLDAAASTDRTQRPDKGGHSINAEVDIWSSPLRVLAALTLAAIFEVGGDALVQWGLRGGRVAGFVLGAVVLFGYGLTVNAPRWDFGRLLGVYICVFFVVSQLVAHFFFHQHIRMPAVVGGAMVIGGGLVMTFWPGSK